MSKNSEFDIDERDDKKDDKKKSEVIEDEPKVPEKEVHEESKAPDKKEDTKSEPEKEEKPVLSGNLSKKKTVSKGDIELSYTGEAIEENAAIVEKSNKGKVFGELEEPTHFVVADGDKSVVWMAMGLTCSIAGTKYKFKKNEKYRVSVGVKDILVNRGALKAL